MGRSGLSSPLKTIGCITRRKEMAFSHALCPPAEGGESIQHGSGLEVLCFPQSEQRFDMTLFKGKRIQTFIPQLRELSGYEPEFPSAIPSRVRAEVSVAFESEVLKLVQKQRHGRSPPH